MRPTETLGLVAGEEVRAIVEGELDGGGVGGLAGARAGEDDV